MIGLVVFVLAVVVVLATSLIKQFGWKSQLTHGVVVVLSVVGGAVGTLGAHNWDFSQFQGGALAATALAVYGASQLLYNFILTGTDFGQNLDAKLTAVGSDSSPGA